MNTTDILIMGGGAIGLAIAVELALQGAAVTVLDRNWQQAALHAAAGMLAPQAEALPASPMLDLSLHSRFLYPEWVAKLEMLTGLSCGYWPCGILAPSYQPLAAPVSLPILPAAGTSQWLDRQAIQQQQPGLSSQVTGGWWFPDDAQVDNRRLARVLRTAAQELGINFQEGVTIQHIQQQHQRITSVETDQGSWQAQQYILATGAWSGELLPIPVVPRKGQMLSLSSPDQQGQPLRQVLYGNEIYLVPRQDGRLIVGATTEDVGFTPHNTAGGVRSLLEAAIKLYPPLEHWPLQEVWWGFRPATPDEWPILGASNYQNLILATGHYRNGILLAPVTATLIADLVIKQHTDPLLHAFHWQRFATDPALHCSQSMLPSV